MRSGAVVEREYGGGNVVLLFQNSGHGVCYGEVGSGGLGEGPLVPFGDADQRVTGSKLKGKYGVAEVVPVYNELGVADEADQLGDG